MNTENMATKSKPRNITYIKNRIPKLLFASFLSLIILFSLLIIFISIPKIQLFMANRISAQYGLALTSFRFNLHPGLKYLTIQFSDIKGLNSSSGVKLGVKSIRYSLNYSDLMSASFYPEILEVIGPDISLLVTEKDDDPGGLKNSVAGLYAFLDSGLPETIKSFSVKNGAVLLDGTTIENFNVSLLRKPEDIKKANFSLDFYVRDKNNRFPFKAGGMFAYNAAGLDFVKISSSFDSVPVPSVPWPESFRGTSGIFSSKGISIEWHKGGSVLASGSIHLPEAGFMLDAYNELKSYNLSGTDIKFEAEFLKSALDIRAFEIKGDDFSLSSSCYIPFDNGANGMSLSVRSSMMPMSRFKALYPAPVTPTWIAKRLLPLFSGGNAKLSDLLIQGPFDRITGLDKKENSSSLLLDIDLDSIDIADFGGSIESKSVSANVLLDKGRLVVSGVKGRIGNSVIRDAVYDYVDTYADKSTENWSISGTFSLQDLHTISESGISPKVVRDTAIDIEDAEGVLDGDIRFSYHPDWKFISITGGKISSKGIGFFHPMVESPIKMDNLNVEFDDKGVAKLGFSGSWRNSVGDIKGTLDIFKGNLKIAGNAMVDAFDISEILKNKSGGSSDIKLKGKQKTDFKISASNWQMKVALNSTLQGFSGKFGGFVLPSLGNDSSLKIGLSQPRANLWKLDNFDLLLGNGRLSASVPVGLGSLHQFSFSLKNFDIGRLGLYHGETGLSFSGKLDGDILIKRLAYGGFYPGVFGEMRATDTGIKMPGLPLVKKGNGRVIFSGQRIYSESLKFGVGDTSLDIFADLMGWKGLKGKIGIKSRDLVLPPSDDDKESEDFVPVFDGDFAMNSDLNVDIDIESGITPSKMRFGRTTATCLFKNGRFDIKDGKMRMPGGEIRFRLIQPEDNKNSILARAYVNLDKQKLTDTFAYIGEEKNISKIDGAVFSTDAYIYCSGKNKKEFISSLGGYIHCNVEDGIIRQSSVIFSILSMLNLEKFLHERPEGVSREGFYFSNLDAGFKIKDGVLSTHDLVIKSPIINIGATGDIDLNNKNLDLDMVAAPLVTIDSFISNLPFVGYILTGNDRALISYYFKVKGPIGAPETNYIPLKNIPKSILGYLQRIFMTPGRIPEEISDMKGLILERE